MKRPNNWISCFNQSTRLVDPPKTSNKYIFKGYDKKSYKNFDSSNFMNFIHKQNVSNKITKICSFFYLIWIKNLNSVKEIFLDLWGIFLLF